MTDHAHPAQTTDFREQKMEWKKLKLSERNGVYMILGAVILLALLQIGASRFGQGENAIGYETDIFMEVLSVAFTILVLDRLAEMREERRLKDRLVHEAGSRSNERAKAAIDDLRHYGWLTGEDGLLKDIYLRGANLEGADLNHATLQGADLYHSNLRKANLSAANLKNAYLREADLHGAELVGIKLQDADLNYADLREANLRASNLQGAQLGNAKLQGANLMYADLAGAVFYDGDLQIYGEGHATMPNDERWHEWMDLEMFTNPNHSNFFDPRKSNAAE